MCHNLQSPAHQVWQDPAGQLQGKRLKATLSKRASSAKDLPPDAGHAAGGWPSAQASCLTLTTPVFITTAVASRTACAAPSLIHEAKTP